MAAITIPAGKGLATFQSDWSDDPGSLADCRDVDLSVPGVWKPRQGYDISVSTATAENITNLYPSTLSADRVFATWGSTYYTDFNLADGITGIVAGPVTYASFEPSFTWDQNDTRVIASSKGPLYQQDSSALGSWALPPTPVKLVTFTNDGTNGFVPANYYIWVRSTYAIEMPDGSILEGPPSAPVLAQNTGTLARMGVTVAKPSAWNIPVPVGPTNVFIRVYVTEPGATPPLVDNFYLGNSGSASFPLSDVGDIVYTLYNYTRDPTRLLYTNSGQEGALQLNNPPGYAKYMESYRGHTFYCADRPARTRKVFRFLRTNITFPAAGASQAVTGQGSNYVDMATTAAFSAGDVVRIDDGVNGEIAVVLSKTATRLTFTHTLALVATYTSAQIYNNALVVNGGVLSYAVSGAGTAAINSAALSTAVSNSYTTGLAETGGAYTTAGWRAAGCFARVSSYYVSANVQYNSAILLEMEDPQATLTVEYKGLTAGTDYVVEDASGYPFEIYVSKQGRPTSVPVAPGHLLSAGDRDTGFTGMAATNDALFLFKPDGVYRLTGDSPSTWAIDPVDPTQECVFDYTAQRMGDHVYFLSRRGVHRVSSGGVELISGAIQDLVRDIVWSGGQIRTTADNALQTYTIHYTNPNDTVNNTVLVYYASTGQWSIHTLPGVATTTPVPMVTVPSNLAGVYTGRFVYGMVNTSAPLRYIRYTLANSRQLDTVGDRYAVAPTSSVFNAPSPLDPDVPTVGAVNVLFASGNGLQLGDVVGLQYSGGTVWGFVYQIASATSLWIATPGYVDATPRTITGSTVLRPISMQMKLNPLSSGTFDSEKSFVALNVALADAKLYSLTLSTQTDLEDQATSLTKLPVSLADGVVTPFPWWSLRTFDFVAAATRPKFTDDGFAGIARGPRWIPIQFSGSQQRGTMLNADLTLTGLRCSMTGMQLVTSDEQQVNLFRDDGG